MQQQPSFGEKCRMTMGVEKILLLGPELSWPDTSM
jgi:hypothetical protein